MTNSQHTTATAADFIKTMILKKKQSKAGGGGGGGEERRGRGSRTSLYIVRR